MSMGSQTIRIGARIEGKMRYLKNLNLTDEELPFCEWGNKGEAEELTSEQAFAAMKRLQKDGFKYFLF